jgi:protein transport protein SEC61 subunit gamma-like protein
MPNSIRTSWDNLNFREFIDSSKRLLRVTTRPNRKELLMLIRLSFLGVIVVGAIGFVVKVLFWIVGLAPK